MIDEVVNYNPADVDDIGEALESGPEIDAVLEKEIESFKETAGGADKPGEPQQQSQDEINSFFFEEDVEKKSQETRKDGESFWE